MNYTFVWVVGFFFCAASVAFSDEAGNGKNQSPPVWKEHGSVSGKDFAIIQIAIPELLKHNLDLSKYKITLIEEADSYSVMFMDADALPGKGSGSVNGSIHSVVEQRGSPGVLPAFDVEVDKTGKRVIGSSFMR